MGTISNFRRLGAAKRGRPLALLQGLESRVLLSTTNPVIFNITESAGPGQVVSIQGDNFGTNPEMWLDRIADSGDTPNLEQKVANVLAKSSQLITAELPSSLQLGLYAMFVKNTDTGAVSAYKFVNQTRGMQYLDLGDTTVRPDETFRMYGRNLDYTPSTTTVKFRNTSTNAVMTATVTQGSDPYILTVKAPASLVAGQTYDILVSNGYGGTYSETLAPQLKALAAGGPDYWGLGTSWATSAYTFSTNVYNIKTDSRLALHAAGDGVTDDSAAIQGAINAANTAGGGVVYFPAGTYNVSGHTFSMKSKVILQGAGMRLSKILDDGGGISTTPLFSGGPSNIGVADLTIECTANGNNSTWKVGGSSSLYQFLLRSRFVNARKEVLVYGSHLMVVDGCEVIHTTLTGKNVIDFSNRQNFIIRNSYIQWSDGRIDILNGAKNIQLENNTFSRSIYTDNTNLGYGGPSVGTANNVAIIGNTFNRLETDTNTKIPKNNDGETLMNENIEYAGTGQVVSATDTTLTQTATTWTVNGKANWEVTIVQGKGMGQTRKITSNTASTLTLSSAWDVNPDATSYYAITKFDENYLVKGNLLQEVPRGIWLTYGGSMRDVAIVDNSLIDGQGIYLRGDTRSGGRFNVQTNITVEGNTLENTKNWYPAQIVVSQVYVSGTELIGNPFYNVMVRDNSIKIPATGGLSGDDGSGAGDGYYARQHNLSDDDTAGLYGVVFDHNTSTNLPAAYSVNSGSYYTVIFNSVNYNVGSIVSDGTMSGDSHASIGTLLAWAEDNRSPAIVSVFAPTPTTAEGSSTPAVFRFARTGTSGDLAVSYTISGTASASDYAANLTGTIVIPNGQQYIDITLPAVDDQVYFEADETLTLTIPANPGYEVGNLTSTVTLIDNDKTTKILQVGFSGTGTGTGGPNDLVDVGGTGAINTGTTSNSATITNASTMGDGNYINLNAASLSDTAPSVTITPTSAANSWAALTTKPGDQWLLNGGFDFFYRRVSGGSDRIFDINNTSSGGWDPYLIMSSGSMRLVVNTKTGGGNWDFTANSAFSAGQTYHVGVTFNTDAVTGLITVRFFKKSGTGAIDTTGTADLLYSGGWNPDETYVTSKMSSAAWKLGVIPLYWATTNNDMDTFRMYNADPHTFGAIDADTAVSVAATDASADEGGNTGTYTFTRNNTAGDLTVYYTMSGSASAGDYGLSPSGNSIVIPDGQSSATLTLTPIADGTTEASESAVLTLVPDAYYAVAGAAATVTIADAASYSLPGITADPGGSYHITFANGVYTVHVDVGTVRFASDVSAGNNTVIIDLAANTVGVLSATQHLEALALATGAVLQIPHASTPTVLVTRQLSLAAGGKIDLFDNAMVIDYTGGPNTTAPAEALVKIGYNGGNWLGGGITSSTAAADRGTYAVGIIDNALQPTPVTSLRGISVPRTATLIRCTYVSDVDMDGAVTSNDAILFANGYADGTSATRQQGDLNFSGVFDSNDAILFANEFNESLPPLDANVQMFSSGALGLAPAVTETQTPAMVSAGSVTTAGETGIATNGRKKGHVRRVELR